MQAIILAAGMGKRFGNLTDNNTKCMLEVNGVKLIDKSLDALSTLNLSRIVIVVGYKAQNLIDYIGNIYNGIEIVYVENPIYYKTNNIYSLLLASNYLSMEDTLLLESDLIFDISVLKKIVDNPYPNLALVDKYESWMDGTVVKIDGDNNIKNFVSKKHFNYLEIEEYYKTVNIYKFTKEFSERFYIPFIEAYSKAYGDNEYYEQVLRVIAFMDNVELKALPLDGEKWYEIDDIQDLDIAESLFARNAEERWEQIHFRYGGFWRYPKMLDFCYLVNPYFPNETMINEMKSTFDTLLREYPSGMGVNSMLAAKYFNVEKEYIVVGNGAAELIKAYIENYVGVLGLVFPTFEEYPNRLLEDQLVKYIPDNPNYEYNVNDIINYFGVTKIDTLLLINPDNPSGNYIPYSDLLILIDWTKKQGVKLIVDESFVDFAKVEGDFSLLDNNVLKNNEHLVVIKSISKSYGVPGLRLGVLASSNQQIITKLKKDVSIWNINSFAEFYMQIFGKYESVYRQACKSFIEEREIFYNELLEIPFLRVIPSQANYFMCEVLGKFKSKELAIKLLNENDILIKDCSNKEAFNEKQYVRIAVRSRSDNSKLIEVLKIMPN